MKLTDREKGLYLAEIKQDIGREATLMAIVLGVQAGAA
jgi:hypothetical protein